MTGFESLLVRAPEACTLPSAAPPPRVAEFADLFATAVEAVQRASPASATVTLPLGLLETARDLAARETECCSFFDFAVEPEGDHAAMTIRVPVQYADVLTAMTGVARGAQ